MQYNLLLPFKCRMILTLNIILYSVMSLCKYSDVFDFNFYRAIHYSAKRGIAIACRPFVCLYVCLSACDVGGSGSRRLEILETTCTDN